VISDVKMPGIGGLELLHRLRALGATIPVIIMTSTTDPPIRLHALEAGAHAYLTKPVADDVLLYHLQSALGRDDSARGDEL
jgi:two-component system response regulator FixJ